MFAQCVGLFPYFEDFESGPASWSSGGLNTDWALGTPSKPRINAAGSGNACWITGGLSNPSYNGGQKSWLQSPCFDFSALSRPYVQFLVFWDTERQYDGGNMQYSTDGGVNWVNVGFNSNSSDCRTQNWFNAPSINNLSGLANPQNGWSGTIVPTSGSCLGGNGSGQWLTASYCLSNLAGVPDVLFRFTFCSGTTCNNYDGLAIDSFTISDIPWPDIDFTYVCETENQVRFEGSGVVCPGSVSWNFGDPASANNASSLISDSHVFSGPGVYTVTLTVNEPCVGSIEKTRTVIIPEYIETVVEVSCPGVNDGAIQLTVPAYTNLQINWSTSPPLTGNSISQLGSGSYQFTLTADSACTLIREIAVPVNPSGSPVPQLPDALLYCPGESIALNPGNFTSYLWSTGETTATIMVSDTGWYTVNVSNSSGCTGSDSVLIRENCFTGMYVPAAFTPNSDGLNDVFKSYSAEVGYFRLEIFNRFGQKIFSADEQEEAWNGTFEEEVCPAGIYGWQIKYTGPDGKTRTIKGLVYLYR
ncbi:MAG: gliding motility-associated C-terminal domain-containing protein [Bacteroidia bacterium]|nr:gliding motility-associated C-terminal domain-containing protein [Bacteroidia bacterium]